MTLGSKCNRPPIVEPLTNITGAGSTADLEQENPWAIPSYNLPTAQWVSANRVFEYFHGPRHPKHHFGSMTTRGCGHVRIARQR